MKNQELSLNIICNSYSNFRDFRYTLTSKILIVTGIIFFLFFFCTLIHSAPKTENPGKILMEHILDSHDWQILPSMKPIEFSDIKIGGLTIPVSRHLVMMLISTSLLIVLFVSGFSNASTIPNKLGIALEPLVLFVRDSIVYPIMGKETGKNWLPFFNTIFFLLLATNLLGIIPLFSTPTGNLSITTALAVMIFIIIFVNGFRKLGFFGFFKNMIPVGIPKPVNYYVFGIECFSLIVRNSVLSIRLFANMIAGHFVIFSLLLLIFIVHPAASIVAVPLALFIDLLEVLVAIIQAFVFTMLSVIFIDMAGSHH